MAYYHHFHAPSIAFSSDASYIERRRPRIPEDILLSIIDRVDVPQLILMAHVCREWRLLAHSHPLFWRRIDVNSVTRAALECMLAKLAASDAPIGRLSLLLAMDDPAVEAVVLPALAAHLHRIEHLLVKLHQPKADALFRVLRAAAPRMKRLEIMLTASDMTMADHVPLPADLLLGDGGTPPQLVQFSGGNILLPEQAVPIFANVVEVAWVASFNEAAADNLLFLSPRRMSAQFPRMRKFSLEGPGCVLAHGLDEGAFAARLETLYVHLNGSARTALARLPVRPPHMKIVSPTYGVLSLVLPDVTHSATGVACCIRACRGDEFGADTSFSVQLTDIRANVVREMTEEFAHFHYKGVPPIFANTNWCAQITELTLEHRIWGTRSIMRALPPLGSLIHLILLLDGADLFRFKHLVKLVCPALRSVKVTSFSPISLRRTSVANFLRRGLSVPVNPLSISSDTTVTLTL